MTARASSLALLLATLVLAGCKEHVANAPVGDRPPATYLWLFPDSTLQTGVSKQHLHWWGEDPDGLVIGYLFSFKIVETNVTTLPSPDTLRYIWVTSTDSTVLFPLDTLFRKFAVVVRSVDNRFRGLPSQSIVRMLPSPYWDRNDNGLYDSGDLLLPDLAGAVDPRGAVQTFPIRNTPPSVAFASNPLDPTSILRQPDTTYTVATFAWNGSDPDGNNTLQSYRIALNDTTQWLTVSLRDTIVTLVVPRSRSDAAPDVRGTPVTVDVWSGSFLGRRFIGQLPKMFLDAPNVFWVEAKDVAGEYSPPMQMPSGPDHWYVRRPRGSVLLVSDYITFDAPLAQGTYLSAINSILGLPPSQVSRLNIGLGLSANDKSVGKAGTLVPSFIDPALIQTFLLFDYVFWYTDFFPSLSVAQLSLFDYIQNGGKVLFSTAFLNTLDPRNALRDFAPIDSVSSVQLSPIIPANYVVYADSSNPANIYPQLAFNASPANHSIYMRPVYRRSDGRYLYHLQADTSVPPRYNGAPNIAVVDGQGAIVFVGVPVHLLNNMQGGLGVTAFLSKVFLQEFNPNHRINRRVF